jgi:hypothetical protein
VAKSAPAQTETSLKQYWWLATPAGFLGIAVLYSEGELTRISAAGGPGGIVVNAAEAPAEQAVKDVSFVFMLVSFATCMPARVLA